MHRVNSTTRSIEKEAGTWISLKEVAILADTFGRI